MEENKYTKSHQYDIWQLYDETHVSRTCTICNYQEILPIDIDILKQIKKQQESLPILNAFLKIPSNDNNIIGYINVIIKDILSYLDQENKIKLITKLNEIILLPSLTEENKLLINNFITSIKENNYDLLFETTEYFQAFNREILTIPQIKEQTNLTK